MKQIDRSLLTSTLLFCLSLTSFSQSKEGDRAKLATDSLFGIQYDPKLVHYELLPQNISTKCFSSHGMQHLIHERPGIFAHAHSGSADYYIVDSTLPIYNEYGWVTVLLVDGNTCTVSGSDWAFSSKPSTTGYVDKSTKERIPTPQDPDMELENSEMYTMRSEHEETMMRTLARDAIQRGIAAHGSDDAFRKLVCTLTIEDGDYPVLNEELRAYCRNANPK